jgi:hypothetical protein
LSFTKASRSSQPIKRFICFNVFSNIVCIFVSLEGLVFDAIIRWRGPSDGEPPITLSHRTPGVDRSERPFRNCCQARNSQSSALARFTIGDFCLFVD